MEKSDDGRIAVATFQIADVLLRKSRLFGEALLSEALLLPQSREV